MGYYTTFELEIIPGSEGIMTELRTPESTAEYAFNDEGEGEEACKGYNLPEEIEKIAKKYPNHIFILEGEGEESGDIWKHYFKGNKEKRINAKLVFPEPPDIFEPNEIQRRAALEEEYGLIKKQQQAMMDEAAEKKKEKIASLKSQLKDLEK